MSNRAESNRGPPLVRKVTTLFVAILCITGTAGVGVALSPATVGPAVGSSGDGPAAGATTVGSHQSGASTTVNAGSERPAVGTSELGSTSPAGAGPSSKQGPVQNVTNVTLITGQTVRVVERTNGTTYAIDADVPMQRISTKQGTYIFPVGTNLQKFDPALFNVDLLMRQGFTDASSDTIPVIVQRDRTRTASTDGDGGMQVSGMHPGETLESVNAVAGTVSKSRAGAAYRDLAAASDVQHVYLDKRLHVSLDTAANAVNAEKARQRYNVTGKNVTVAVLDTGVDASHPDLDDAVVDRVDFSGDGTGDAVGHGTHVAGIIAGDGSASDGTYVGMAPDANIMSVKVLGDDGYGSTSDIIEGLEYATNNGADVVSMSLGGSVSQNDPLTQAVNEAGRNVTVVVAAGNWGNDYFSVNSPGNAENVITVGASDGSGQLAWFSSRGPTPLEFRVKPDLVAPGVDIMSAEAGTTGYVEKSGTSMATPVVSGIAALLEAERDPSPRETKTLLASTADRISAGSVYAQGAGRVNATAALGADLVVGNASVDYGTFSTETNRTRVVSITNVGNETRTVAVDATAVNVNTDTTYDSVTNVSSLELSPGETAHVALTVNGSRPQGIYSGRLALGNYTVTYGFVTGIHRVTVEKRSLSGTAANVSNDQVLLVSNFTKPFTWRTRSTVTDGNVTLYAFEGNYTVMSSGVAEDSGRPVMLAKQVRVNETSTSFTIDESNTVVYDVDTSKLADGAPLTTVELQSNLYKRWTDIQIHRSYGGDIPTSARYSTSTAVNATIETIVAPSAEHDGGLDTPRAYHLVYGTAGVDGPRTFTPDESSLATVQYDFYRTTPNASYEFVHFGESTKVGHFGDTSGIWRLGGRQTLTIFLTNQSRYMPAADSWEPRWNLFTETELVVDSPSDRFNASVNEHPYIARTDDWSVNENYDGTAEFWFSAMARADQLPLSMGDDDDTGTTALVVRRNGSVVTEKTGDYGGDLDYSDEPVRNGTHYDVRTYGTNAKRNLSTAVLAEWVFTYRENTDNRPPDILATKPANMSQYSAVPAGNVTVHVTVREATSLSDLTVAWAPAGVDTAAFGENATGLDANWTAASTVEVVGTSGDTTTFAVTFDAGDYQGKVHLATRARDEAGNAMAVTTFEAFPVGQTTGSSGGTDDTGTITGQFVDENDTALADDFAVADDDVDTFQVRETSATGNFTVDVPANDTYSVGYVQNASTGIAPRDGVVDVYEVDSVAVGNGTVDLGTRTIPNGHVLNVQVVDESGDPVENASVSVYPDDAGGVNGVGIVDQTGSDGYFGFSDRGVEVVGNVTVEVTPPENASGFVAQTYSRNLTVTSDRNVTVTLNETETANLTLSARLVDPAGDPLPGDALSIHSRDGHTSDTANESGVVSFSVQNDTTYVQGFYDRVAATDEVLNRNGVPDVYSLGHVRVNDTSVDRGNVTIPRGHVVNITVVDESGDPVENTTVDVTSWASDAEHSGWGVGDFKTDAKGRYVPFSADQPGIELAGWVSVEVTPPADATRFTNTTVKENFSVTGARNVTITLPESSGSVTLNLTANRTQLVKGETVRFELRRADTGNLTDGVVSVGNQTTVDTGPDGVVNVTVSETGNVTVVADKQSTSSTEFERDSVTLSVAEPAKLVTSYEVNRTELPTNATLGVAATVRNQGDVEGTERVDLVVDGTVVATRNVTVAGGESESVTFARSFDAARIHEVTVNDLQATDVAVEHPVPVAFANGSVTTTKDENETVDVVVENVTGGVGALNVSLAVDTTNVRIVDVTVHGSPAESSTNAGPDGRTTTVEAYGMDTANTGDVTVLTVTLRGENAGNATVTATPTGLFDETGYPYYPTSDATAEVTVNTVPAVGNFSSPPTDVDGDGTFEDVNGDGAFTLSDVTAFWQNRDDEVVQNHPDAFDYNGVEGVNLGDVQRLFTEATED